MPTDANKLKMTLQELRNSIDIQKSEWTSDNSNCYAYALGLDIPQYQIKDCAYAPGVIADSEIDLPSKKIFLYKDLINNLYLDFDALGIRFREINPLDTIGSNEWKIALFITWYQEPELVEDYHFLRQHNDGIWYHKKGFRGEVSKYDSNGKIITNPQECFFRYRHYNKCLSLALTK